ncbi:MAG: hypothetical protein ABFR33_08085, partial [Verrucomicrobiota bacterium]
LVLVAIWIPVSIEASKIRGKILVRDAETKQPVASATVLFEVSQTLTQIYPPTRAGYVSASRTDEQGLAQIPDISGSNWVTATRFRICVLSDGHKKHIRGFYRDRFGKNGSDCRAVKVKLEREK